MHSSSAGHCSLPWFYREIGSCSSALTSPEMETRTLHWEKSSTEWRGNSLNSQIQSSPSRSFLLWCSGWAPPGTPHPEERHRNASGRSVASSLRIWRTFGMMREDQLASCSSPRRPDWKGIISSVTFRWDDLIGINLHMRSYFHHFVMYHIIQRVSGVQSNRKSLVLVNGQVNPGGFWL